MTEDALSGLAAALEVPVQLLAIALLAVLAYEVGRLVTEGWRRVRPGAQPVRVTAADVFAADDPQAAGQLARRAPGPLVERALLDLDASLRAGAPDGLEHALADFELGVQRRLDRTRMLVRAGPALGLMGTLIPLAPGLSALGEGDYQQLAEDLQTAFAATVIGILVGTAAFALTLVRTRRATEDLAGLERAVAERRPQDPPHARLATVEAAA